METPTEERDEIIADIEDIEALEEAPAPPAPPVNPVHKLLMEARRAGKDKTVDALVHATRTGRLSPRQMQRKLQRIEKSLKIKQDERPPLESVRETVERLRIN